MTITETTRGWGFTHQGRRYEYPTRDEAAERLYDLQHGKAPAHDAVDAALAPATTPLVTVERHWGDEDEHPDAPPPGASVWTDYQSGCVLFGVDADGGGVDLNICRTLLDHVPVTLATLTQIHADLGNLLADARVRAALPAGEPGATDTPPTRMVRVKEFRADCSFSMFVYLTAAAAIERNRGTLNLLRSQVFEIATIIADVVEDLFDLTNPLGLATDKLVDAAYAQGANDAATAIIADARRTRREAQPC